MNLYPLKFIPILKSIIWGGSAICEFKDIAPRQVGIGESWEISGVEGSVSVVAEGPLQGKPLDELVAEYRGALVGNEVYNRFGDKFPLLIKFIDAQDDLSIQVHPDDELGMKRHNSFGKTEMWYVINADEGAFLYSGFDKMITPEGYVESIENNTFVEALARHKVKKGDVFFLPAGRVHAIGAGSFIAEIQQTSDVTYRIYDYKRKGLDGKERELHTELAKDAIDFKVYDSYRTDYIEKKNEAVLLEACEYFTTSLLDLDKEIDRDYSEKDSFVILICMGGACSVTDENGYQIQVKQGETILLPAQTKNVKINPKGSVLMLETFV